MYQISLINKLLIKYKIWTIKLNTASKSIENNILQNDTNNALEEKLASIAISSIIMYLGTGFIGLFGISSSGFGAAIVLFGIGWLLSKAINKRVFGTPRKEEDLKDDELLLLSVMKQIILAHENIRDSINNNSIIVIFKDYSKLKQDFEDVVFKLNYFNTSHLALKYRYKHKILASKYKMQVSQFHSIYAHKNRG